MNGSTRPSAVRFAAGICLPAMAALSSVPAFAGTVVDADDTIVVTAAGFEQKVTEAPASISVITAEDLENRPYMTLLDAVRDLEGVDIGETRDKTGQGTISLRGMGSDYTLILINGRRQNNHGNIYPNDFGGNQFNHIPPRDSIERIEVIRGPASTLYGADAMGGVINIITKRNLDRWRGSVTVSRTFEEKSAYGDDTTVDVYANGPILPGLLSLSVRGSFYKRDASNPVYRPVIDPNGVDIARTLGFGTGGKTVDNENLSGGFTLAFTPTDNQTLTFDYDASRQKYDNKIKINDSGVEEYPVGTVDNYGAMLRIGNNGRVEPRAGYSPSQQFTRNAWSVSHEGRWSFGNSRVTLSHVATNNDGRTLPFSVAERQSLQTLWNAACVSLGGTVNGGTGYCPTGGTGYSNANAFNNLSEARKLKVMQENLTADQFRALQAYLPRPKRTLESSQYTLDAQMDIPFALAGEHTAVIGGQVIRGELTDGVFGLETGTPGLKQKHNMWSLFAEDTWRILPILSITGGLRYDKHQLFGDHLSPRLYGVLNISDQWTVKGGVSTGFKTPKTTDLYDGITGFGSQGTSPFFGNPNLKPETSVSTELAVYWEHSQGHNFNATVFRNSFDDKISSQPCGAGTDLPCADTGDFADLGYTSTSRVTNIDKVVIQGVELAGRINFFDGLRLRANYTLTDSEQKSGTNAGRPLGNSARHMANASLDWRVAKGFSILLTGEMRSKRYRNVHIFTGDELYYKSYAIMNLGAAYEPTNWLTLNVRVNNLFNKDFTTYDAEFRDVNGDGLYDGTNTGGVSGRNETLFFDHYNNKDKMRSLWVSLNARF